MNGPGEGKILLSRGIAIGVKALIPFSSFCACLAAALAGLQEAEDSAAFMPEVATGDPR